MNKRIAMQHFLELALEGLDKKQFEMCRQAIIGAMKLNTQ